MNSAVRAQKNCRSAANKKAESAASSRFGNPTDFFDRRVHFDVEDWFLVEALEEKDMRWESEEVGS
jgi:hypothetical protein